METVDLESQMITGVNQDGKDPGVWAPVYRCDLCEETFPGNQYSKAKALEIIRESSAESLVFHHCSELACGIAHLVGIRYEK